jgi:hypothetical protein
MTLSPAEIAQFDQKYAGWIDWYARQHDDALASLLARVRRFLKEGGRLSDVDRDTLLSVFTNAMILLQIAAQARNE